MTDWRHASLSLSWSQGQAIYNVTEIPLYSWHMTARLPSYPAVHIPFRVFSGHLEKSSKSPRPEVLQRDCVSLAIGGSQQ